MEKTIQHISGSAGGYLVGKSHADGGIQAINKAVGKPLEMEGGEVVITEPAVSDTKTINTFNGKRMTNREVLSAINVSGNGVSFAELGAELPKKIEFSDEIYEFNGENINGHEIAHRISKCGCSHDKETFADGGELTTLDNLSIKNSINDVEYRLIKMILPIFPELKVDKIIELSDRIAAYDNEKRDSQHTAEAIQYLSQDFSNFDRNNDFNKKSVERLEAFGIIPKLENLPSTEITTLHISPNNNLSKQLVEYTGDYWNAHDFANVDEIPGDLSFIKPFYHKKSGQKFVVAENNQNNETKPTQQKVYDLGSSFAGGAVSVWDRNQTKGGDYKTIAFVYSNGTIKYLEDNLPQSVIDFVEKIKHPDNKTNKPKYAVGDYVSYKTGDIEIENWIGVVKEVKDYGNEIKYRLDAYTTNVDPPMFDSAKTNEVFEAVLKPIIFPRLFDFSKKAYENKKVAENHIDDIHRDNDTIIELKNGTNNDVSGQLFTQTGEDFITGEFENIKGSKNTLDTGKPFIHKNSGKTFVVTNEKNYQISDYKNPYEVNRAIENLIDNKEDNFTPNEIEFISNYSGYGGLEKQGTFSDEELKGLLYEYFTPDAIVKKMWALAYKFGFGEISQPHVLEPSVGTGNFFKYAPANAEIFGNEINDYSKRVCEILYPKAMIMLQPFEKNFINKNNSVKNKLNDLHKYHLVIGNPPYGRAVSKFLAMGETDYTKASNFTEYFITRGLDLLHSGGLLIFVVGAEQYNGGTLFLDSGISAVKKQIFDKAQLVDAYRLPTKIFERTGVASEILVFKKK